MKTLNQFRARGVAAACLVILLSVLASAQQNAPALTAGQIAAQMASQNQKRAEALKHYTGAREYRLVYEGFPTRKEAAMKVESCFDAPGHKEFTVVSQTGSGFMVNKVLKRLLESEQEAGSEEHRARTALNEKNYDFALLGQETVGGRPAYMLQVSPKVDNKFLYRGKIWVDASDFAVVKIDAEPAKRPSFWISSTKIKHAYTKIGEFWLPAENVSTTDVRLGGVAKLTIRYNNYEINQGSAQCVALPERKSEVAENKVGK
jgi:hypothetical protein